MRVRWPGRLAADWAVACIHPPPSLGHLRPRIGRRHLHPLELRPTTGIRSVSQSPGRPIGSRCPGRGSSTESRDWLRLLATRRDWLRQVDLLAPRARLAEVIANPWVARLRVRSSPCRSRVGDRGSEPGPTAGPPRPESLPSAYRGRPSPGPALPSSPHRRASRSCRIVAPSPCAPSSSRPTTPTPSSRTSTRSGS